MKPKWQILVVEDNEDDAFFMRRALRGAAPDAVTEFLTDGQAALDYLRASGPYAHRAGEPLPNLVFLDLKLPYVHGFEVLATIRGSATMRALPVVALTSSGEERDRSRAEALGVLAYLVKPPTRATLATVLSQVEAAAASPSASTAPARSESHAGHAAEAHA